MWLNISDYSPLRLQISISGSKLWFNPFWFNLFPAKDPLPKEIQTFLHYNRGSAEPRVVWIALKAHVRGALLDRLSTFKMTTKAWETPVLSEA